MYKVTLERIKNGVALRSDAITGYTTNLPETGKSFQLVAESATPGADGRFVTTSTVQSIEQTEHTYLFRTLNSVYHVTVEGKVS